jgi:signal transduction histidine kinase
MRRVCQARLTYANGLCGLGRRVHSAAFVDTYGQVLADYLKTRSEDALYRASLLSQTFVEHDVGPEEIIALHFEALERAMAAYSYREQARAIGDAHQFLLEVMITYGVKYKEYLELRVRDSLREAEARAAADRQRALDAERAERERAELLTEIAHELRTPLTAAMGSIDLAARHLSHGRTERLTPLLGSAREAMDRLSRLSAELMQATRGEAPQLFPARQNFTSLLDQACSWADPAALDKGVTLTREPGPELVEIWGDADAILSVIGNLLSNAIRYTPAGGVVTVRHGVDNAWCWVEVADTGIGLSPEARSQVFERFYRAPEARALDAQGLGLGLTLVHQLVVAHNGRVEVESTPGAGSAFRVLLPAVATRTESTTDDTRPSVNA